MFFSVGKPRPNGELVDGELNKKCPKLLSRMMIRRRSVERLPLEPIPVAAAAAAERDLGTVCAAAARAAATERDTAASARAGANARRARWP